MIPLVAGIAIILVASIIIGTSVLLTRKPAGSEKGEQDTVKTLFHYLVLFATLMMMIGGSVSAVMALADIVSPPPYYQSFESYKEMKQSELQTAPVNEEELRQRYELMAQEEKRTASARAMNSLIKSLAWVVIPFPIFLYFQRNVKKAPS